MTTYTITNNEITITIENRKRYWLLSAEMSNGIILLHNALRVHNTLRSAKATAQTILSNAK
jgi:hypothetical protein